MRTPWGTLLRSLAVAVLVLGASACSDDPAPAGKAPTSQPTTTSSTPTPTATPVEQQVEETMRAYFAAANEMFKSGDVAKLRAFSLPSCPCRKITRDVERITVSGGSYRGTEYRIRKVRVHDVVANSAAVEVSADVPPYKVVDGSGKLLENSSGGRLHTDFSLIRQGDRWVVTNAVNLG